MKKIIIYNKPFFALSETFIERQYRLVKEELNITLLGRTYSSKDLDKPPLFFQFLISTEREVMRFLKLKKNHSLYISTTFTLLYYKLVYGRNLIVHLHYGTNATLFYKRLRFFKIKYIVSFHGKDASAALLKTKYKTLLPSIFRNSTAIIICSKHMVDSLELKDYQSKVHFIPYAVDIDQIRKENYYIDEFYKKVDINILHVGRLTSKKGVPDLILAFCEINKQYPNVKLHIVGKGDELDECRRLISDFKLEESVKMYGALEREEVMKHMANCNIFVLNSRIGKDGDMEGFPNVILEAMSMSKAVISTNHAGIPSAILHNQTGLLIEEKNNEGLKNAMLTLISEPETRLRLGGNARQHVVKQFNYDIMKKRLLNVYKL